MFTSSGCCVATLRFHLHPQHLLWLLAASWGYNHPALWRNALWRNAKMWRPPESQGLALIWRPLLPQGGISSRVCLVVQSSMWDPSNSGLWGSSLPLNKWLLLALLLGELTCDIRWIWEITASLLLISPLLKCDCYSLWPYHFVVDRKCSGST